MHTDRKGHKRSADPGGQAGRPSAGRRPGEMAEQNQFVLAQPLELASEAIAAEYSPRFGQRRWVA